jgi:hypothetical protein
MFEYRDLGAIELRSGRASSPLCPPTFRVCGVGKKRKVLSALNEMTILTI